MEDLRYICAWCRKRIKLTDSLYSVMGISPPTFDVESMRDKWMELEFKTIDKIIPAFFFPKDSCYQKEGYDLVCVACSEKCADSLKKNLDNEIKLLGKKVC